MADQVPEVPLGSDLVREYAAHIAGTTVLVTGVSTGGLGAHFVDAIAVAHPKLIILAGRSAEKTESTARALSARFPAVPTRVLQLDLASQAAVRQAAATVNAWDDVPAIDVLVLNAGVMAIPYARTVDGLEMQFGANYVGHWLFANLIMDKVLTGSQPAAPAAAAVVSTRAVQKEAGDKSVHADTSTASAPAASLSSSSSSLSHHGLPVDERQQQSTSNPAGSDGRRAGGRVVSVASDGFLSGAIRFDDLGFGGGAYYNPWRAYGQSKTANALYAVALAARLAHRGLTALSVHPGNIFSTNLAGHMPSPGGNGSSDNDKNEDSGKANQEDAGQVQEREQEQAGTTPTTTAKTKKALAIGEYKDVNEAIEALFTLDREQGNARGTSGFKPIDEDRGVATHIFAAFAPHLPFSSSLSSSSSSSSLSWSSSIPPSANGSLCWEARVSRPDEVRAWARDPVEAARLWAVTEELIGQKFEW